MFAANKLSAIELWTMLKLIINSEMLAYLAKPILFTGRSTGVF